MPANNQDIRFAVDNLIQSSQDVPIPADLCKKANILFHTSRKVLGFC